MKKPDPSTWVLAAHGELGAAISWRPEFKVIERAKRSLSLLDEVGEDRVEWRLLLNGLPRLSVLASMEFPPLCVERGFDEIDGFLTIASEPVTELPGQSFNQIEIYVARDDLSDLIREFGELDDRLSAYPPLVSYL